MKNEEIEAKIKQLKSTIKSFEIEIAKNEERIKNQEKQKDEYVSELKALGIDVDPNTNLDSIIEKYEAELEAELALLEAEIANVKNQIAKNNE